MISQRIGVVIESLGLRTKEGIKTASNLGFKGIQIDATQRDITPENLSETGRRELKRIIDLNRLSLCALGGEIGTGFKNENEFDFLIKRIKKIINLALDLQTNIITIQIGNIPKKADSTYSNAVNASLEEIGTHAENYGCRLAAQFSIDNYSTLKKFLASLQTQGIKLIYDPASLITNNMDPIKYIYELHKYIFHTNIWDTRQKGESIRTEVPIGEGIVPVQEFISTLESTGYNGFYVIDSKGFQQPVETIRKGKKFLEKL